VAKLTYSSLASVDGYTVDADGNFDWAEPDEEVHTSFNDLARSVGTYLLGRRMYEVLVAWETLGTAEDEPAYIRDFGDAWRSADKVVYSSTLEAVSSGRTSIEREFDPEAVRRMKASADRDLTIGGPGLAAHAIATGLVDEYHVFLVPTAVGGGTPFFPAGVRLDLALTDERRFASGTVALRYEPRSGS
jgi:dihydrofolate reductase